MRSVWSSVAGLLILLAGTGLLWWNEARTLSQRQSLAEGATIVVSVPTEPLDSRNEAKLIHVAGPTSGAALRDGELGIETEGLLLSRKVEMLQWRESHKSRNSNASQESDFNYSREWSETAVDWTQFRFPQDHQNPPMPSLASREFTADRTRLGAFELGEKTVRMLGTGRAFNAPAPVLQAIGDKLGRPARPIEGGLFAGADPAAPRVGDIRILYLLLPHQTVSVVGRQTGRAITGFRAPDGEDILLARAGKHDAAEMFDTAQSENTAAAWFLRLLGAVLIYIAFRVVLHPLRAIAAYVPLADTILSRGIGFVALTASGTTAAAVIAIAWLAHRPLGALLLLVLAGGGIVLLFAYRRQRLGTPTAQLASNKNGRGVATAALCRAP